MAAAQPPVAQGDVCPDPTAHGRVPSLLQDQASKAALYVTQPDRDNDHGRASPPEAEGKLSSSSAAASLKHAKPHELPSFPSVGIDTTNSGSTAANLAHSNQKSFEHWRPGDLSSTAGKAALIAHKDGGKLNLWSATASEPGHTAAGAAMLKQKGLSPKMDYGYTDDGRQKALLAAKLSVRGRTRSGSTPAPVKSPQYPDAENAGHNALNAASIAHRPTVPRKQSPYRVSSAANEAARLTHMQGNINRDMFGEHPPIGGETEQERKRKAALKGAALAHTRKADDAATEAQRNPHPALDPALYARNHLSIQEQAQKLAAERLNKLDPDGVRAYREHYGYSAPLRNRLSIRNRRVRSRSEGHESKVDSDSDDDDARRAGRIRHQMSRFNDQLNSVDQKRQTDRSTLMLAAQKSVKQRMSTMDQQIFDETGKVTPTVLEQWEAKARARAAEQSEKRLENHGMVHIGGGKYMNEKEVEAIAASRMQPTLDEISANAEKQRARDEELRVEQETKRDEAAKEKQRNQDNKTAAKQAKQEEKEFAKTKKRLQKEENRQQKEAEKEQGQKAKEAARSEDTSKLSTDDSTKVEEGVTTTTAAGAPAPEVDNAKDKKTDKSNDKSSVPKESRGFVSQKLTRGEKFAMGATVQDPPGIPTSFEGQRSQVHPELKGKDIEGEAPNEIQTLSGPRDVQFKRNDKRDSRVRSWLGKLTRSGKTGARAHDDSGSESTVRSKDAKESRPSKESRASKESKDNRPSDDDSGEDGLYSHFKEASREEEDGLGADDGLSKKKKKQAEPSIDEVMSGAQVREDNKEREKDRSISPPTPRDDQDSTRGRVRESIVSNTTTDEFEEAKDKFDEDDLKPPEIPAGRPSQAESSPSRSHSRFIEDL
ncbi:MAG: hypothetical protein Q9159_002505 [Coniocarpon cinnabarinum]